MGWGKYIRAFGPALISAGSSLYGSHLQRQQSLENTAMTIEARKELAKYKFQQDVKMWNMMKAYNAPVKQMQRFKQAGLNPNLIYGQGTPGNVSSYPTFEAPQVSYHNRKALDFGGAVNQGLQTYYDVRQSEAQIDQTQALADKAEWDAMRAEWLTKSAEIQAMFDIRENELAAIFHGEIKKNLGTYINAKWQDFIANASKQSKINVAQDLKNAYQRELNKLIKKGLTPNDVIYLRIGLSLMNALGLDVTSLQSQLNNALSQ